MKVMLDRETRAAATLYFYTLSLNFSEEVESVLLLLPESLGTSTGVKTVWREVLAFCAETCLSLWRAGGQVLQVCDESNPDVTPDSPA